jgi:hypothetical protein
MISDSARNILRFIIPTILSVALGVLVCQILSSGYLSQWVQINPPERISRFLRTRSGDLWAEAANGNVYLCSDIQCQRENGAPPTTDNFEILRRCSPYISDWPMFSPSTHPPQSLVDCRETILFLDRDAFALDNDSNLWYWRQNGVNGELFGLGLLSLLFSPVIGIAIGWILLWRVKGDHRH